MKKKKEIATALGEGYESHKAYGIVSGAYVIPRLELQALIRQRVRELWCTEDGKWIRLLLFHDRLEVECVEGNVNGNQVSQCFTGDTEAFAWEEALLWLAERGSDA